MMKSLLAANRSEKDSFRIPHSVQQSIPIRRIFTDGIWQVGQKYSKTWRFSDINYAASSLDDRRSIFRSYGAVLNSLPTDATAKITIINRRLNPVVQSWQTSLYRRGGSMRGSARFCASRWTA